MPSCNRCFLGKAISIIYSECVCVFLVIQHAMCMSRIVMLFVSFVAVLRFPDYLIHGSILGKEFLNINRVF